MPVIKIYSIIICMLASGPAPGAQGKDEPMPPPKPRQQPRVFKQDDPKPVTRGYLLYLPKDGGRAGAKRPLVLFLHGAGERGDNLDLVKKHGPPKLVEAGKDFPFILVSPQCPKESVWTNETDILAALLDEIAAKHPVDADRVYLTGLSMGGMGTWALASAQPKRFAAIAPICGGGDPTKAPLIKDVPTWVFHGAKDKTVPIQKSEEMVAALKAAGGDPKFTVYPEAGHDSWTGTYNNPDFWTWLLAHKRKK